MKWRQEPPLGRTKGAGSDRCYCDERCEQDAPSRTDRFRCLRLGLRTYPSVDGLSLFYVLHLVRGTWAVPIPPL